MFAVYQNGYTIYGTGETKADAIENAKKWMDRGLGVLEEIIIEMPQDVNDGDLCIAKCDLDLHKAFMEEDGDFTYYYNHDKNILTLID